MEENVITQCPNCSKILAPKKIYFCGGCMTQIRCKVCDSILDVDDVGCTNCGTLRETRNSTPLPGIINANTFRLHETNSDRTIEATFSDSVGKDLAGILRDLSGNGKIKSIPVSEYEVPKIDTQEFEQNVETIDADYSIQEKNVIVEKEINQKEKLQNVVEIENYPTLKAIAMKNLPSSEVEWVVVYSFYASQFGKDTFTRQDLIAKYDESKRLDNDKKNRLSTNIGRAVRGNFINPLSEGYSILNEGVEKAKEIISRTTASQAKPKASSKTKKDNSIESDKSSKKKTSNGTKYKVLSDIDFHPSGEKKLDDFVQEYNPKNDSERNLLFTYYLSKILKIQKITLDHLFTCYDAMKYKLPENMLGSFNNTKTRTSWLTGDKSNIEITTKGLNHFRNWKSQ